MLVVRLQVVGQGALFGDVADHAVHPSSSARRSVLRRQRAPQQRSVAGARDREMTRLP